MRGPATTDDDKACTGPRRDQDDLACELGSVGRLAKVGDEVVDLTLGLGTLGAVAGLDAADELLAAAGDLVKIVVRQVTPVLADGALELLPVPLDLIPVHDVSSRVLPGEPSVARGST